MNRFGKIIRKGAADGNCKRSAVDVVMMMG